MIGIEFGYIPYREFKNFGAVMYALRKETRRLGFDPNELVYEMWSAGNKAYLDARIISPIFKTKIMIGCVHLHDMWKVV